MGAELAARAAGEAGARLLSPGRPHCSGLALLSAELVLSEGGVGPVAPVCPHLRHR